MTTYDGDAIERASPPEGSDHHKGADEVADRDDRGLSRARASVSPSISGRVRADRRVPRRRGTLESGQAYCSGCGKPRPIVGTAPAAKPSGDTMFGSVNFGKAAPLDPRYVTVQCGRVTRPGLFDRAQARQIIRERRARRKAVKAEIKKAYGTRPNEDRTAVEPTPQRVVRRLMEPVK